MAVAPERLDQVQELARLGVLDELWKRVLQFQAEPAQRVEEAQKDEVFADLEVRHEV